MKEASPDAVCIIFGSLLGVCENFMCRLYCLKFCVELHLLAGIAIGMVFERWRNFRVSLCSKIVG